MSPAPAVRDGKVAGRGWPQVVRKALVVALVVLVALTGLPVLAGGMGMAACFDCGPATASAGAGCVLLPSALAFLVALVAHALRLRSLRLVGLLEATALYRPPRLA